MIFVKEWLNTGMRLSTFISKDIYIVTDILYATNQIELINLESGKKITSSLVSTMQDIKELTDFSGEIIAIRKYKHGDLEKYDVIVHNKYIVDIKQINRLKSFQELHSYLYKLNVLENIENLIYQKNGTFTLILPDRTKGNYKQGYSIIIREDTIYDIIRIEIQKDVYLYHLEQRANLFGSGQNE